MSPWTANSKSDVITCEPSDNVGDVCQHVLARLNHVVHTWEQQFGEILYLRSVTLASLPESRDGYLGIDFAESGTLCPDNCLPTQLEIGSIVILLTRSPLDVAISGSVEVVLWSPERV
jgi:hypothetical protein